MVFKKRIIHIIFKVSYLFLLLINSHYFKYVSQNFIFYYSFCKLVKKYIFNYILKLNLYYYSVIFKTKEDNNHSKFVLILYMFNQSLKFMRSKTFK